MRHHFSKAVICELAGRRAKQKGAEPAGENDATAGRPEFPRLDLDLRGSNHGKNIPLLAPPAG